MSNSRKKSERISIEHGTWYYFTMDASHLALGMFHSLGFASFSFVKYIEAIDVTGHRKAAIVQFLEKDYFPIQDVLLLPDSRKWNYFRARPDEMLSVWTLDAAKIGDAHIVDLKSEWPTNILAAALITPSIEKASQWTVQSF